MIRHIDVRGRVAAGQRPDYRALVPRAAFDVDAAVEQVRPLCEAVRLDGHAELVRQAARFDGVAISSVRVPAEAVHAALSTLDHDLRTSLEESVRRLRLTCEAELPTDVSTTVTDG